MIGLALSLTMDCHEDKINNLPLISFKQFKNLYLMNPDGWSIKSHNTHPRYKKDFCSEGYYKPVKIGFKTPLDYAKYKRFAKNVDKIEKENINNKAMEELIQCWLKDIEKEKKKAQKEIHTASVQATKILSKNLVG